MIKINRKEREENKQRKGGNTLHPLWKTLRPLRLNKTNNCYIRIMDAKQRFSDRVENYIRYWPGYPEEIIPALQLDIGLMPNDVVADIGSGTGLSAQLFFPQKYREKILFNKNKTAFNSFFFLQLIFFNSLLQKFQA